MQDKRWSWLSDKELECLLNIDELPQEDVIIDVSKESKSFKTDVTVHPRFKLGEGKILILISYKDVKRIFKTMQELKVHFKNNLFLRNTEKTIDGELKLKKRSRFFVVPKEFSKNCLQFLYKIADPESGIDDINQLVGELKGERDKTTLGEEVKKKIVKDIPASED